MNLKKDKDKFNFFIPANFVKGGKDGKQMYIKGIASSEVEDSDGETLIPAGYDLSPLLKNGFLNYNHQAAKDPSAIIGEPTKAEVVNDGKDLYIEGYLYQDSDLAQKTYQLAKTLEKNSPNRRMGFSIEGKALERDPLNPQRITKAKITGVAITPCPKNPNTLLSIVKGEYSEAFVDLDEEEEDAEKAMTAVAGEGTIQTESVDGGEKQFKKLLKDQKEEMKKSEAYELIFNKYGDSFKNDIEKAKQIFQLIQKINNTMENTNNTIFTDALNKAFSIIDDEIVKAKKSEDVEEKVEEKEEVVENEMESEDEVENDNEENEDEDEEVVEKGHKEEFMTTETPVGNSTYGGVQIYLKTIIKESFAKGQKTDEIVEDLVEKGMDRSFVTDFVKVVEDEMSALHANGGITKEGTDVETVTIQPSTHSPNPILSKSEEDLLNNLNIFKAEVDDDRDEIIKAVTSKFNSLAVILKSNRDNFESLNNENVELKKSLAEIAQKLDVIAKTPQPRKSVVSAGQVAERFESEINKSQTASKVYSLGNIDHINQLTVELQSAFDEKMSKGEDSRDLGNAILELALVKGFDHSTLNKIQPTLTNRNIEVVIPQKA